MDVIQGELRAAIMLVEGDGLPQRDVQNAWSLVDAGEPGVALENLCTQLYENDVAVSQRAHDLLTSASTAMGIDASYVGDLTVRGPGEDEGRSSSPS